jgi:hypothetical protein
MAAAVGLQNVGFYNSFDMAVCPRRLYRVLMTLLYKFPPECLKPISSIL